jgi:hypothetical protein
LSFEIFFSFQASLTLLLTELFESCPDDIFIVELNVGSYLRPRLWLNPDEALANSFFLEKVIV